MTAIGWTQIALFFVAVLALTRPLGAYMFRVFEGTRQPAPSVLGRAERFLYRLCGVDPAREQTWPVYAFSLLATGVDAAESVEETLDPPEYCRERLPISLEDAEHVRAERLRQREH